MHIATINAAGAIVHQGRKIPATKLSNAVMRMEIKNFIR
jgi:hypothetical protein